MNVTWNYVYSLFKAFSPYHITYYRTNLKLHIQACTQAVSVYTNYLGTTPTGKIQRDHKLSLKQKSIQCQIAQSHELSVSIGN